MLKRISLLVSMLVFIALFLPSGFTGAQGFSGFNWTGFFYNNVNFTGTPEATVVYPTGLDFNWPGPPEDGDGNPVTWGPAPQQEDNFSVRFLGSQQFPQSGNWIFEGFVDDQVRIFIGGATTPAVEQLVPGNFSVSVPITAGTYNMRVDFVEFTQVAALTLTWRLDTGTVAPTFPPPGFVATPAPVFTPTPTGPILPPGPIGQVVNVNGLSLRSGPYLGASFIGVLRPGIAYPVLAQNNDEGGGFTWYRVQNGNQVGWASGRYLLVFNGEPPQESTVFETLSDPPSTGVIATPNAFINVRRRPSQRSARIGDLQVEWGGLVEVLGRTVQGGRNHWLLVRYEGVVGWVFAPYFRTVRGSFNQVPIY